jgi:spore maturation protein CgeB
LKITIFGLTITSSWGNGHATPYRALLKALHRRGHRVAFYERDATYYRLRRDFERAEYCDVMLYENWQAVRQRALTDAASSDVVINASYCPEGSRIADEVLELPQPLHVFYDLDTPITLQQMESGAGCGYLRRQQVPAFDLYLSFTGGGILDELESAYGARRAEALYGCVDPEVHRPVAVREDFRCALSYVGTYAADRQQTLDELFLAPARYAPEKTFSLAGSLYPWQWQWPANVRRVEHVAPAEHAALYCSSQATLNITRAGMARWGWCPSGRFFEAAACGTPVISDYFAGLETFFAPGEEIVLARSGSDVLTALEAPAMLAQMAQRARTRTLDEHTGEQRAEQLLGYLSERGPARETQSRPAEVAS